MKIKQLAGMLLPMLVLSLAACETQQIRTTGNIIIKEKPKQQQNREKPQIPAIEEQVLAVKEALLAGASKAVGVLGKKGGFAASNLYHIPLPDSLQKVSSNLRTIGLGKYVERFEASLNRAAEKSVPYVLDSFNDMVRNMSIDNAISLIKGKESAITDYFRSHYNTQLRQLVLQKVSKATAEVGVTGLYNQLQGQAALFGAGLTDINPYISDYVLKAIYTELAGVEKSIRKQSFAAASNLVKKVFGYQK